LKKVADYLGHAAECRDLARRAPPSHRRQLEEMAQTWERMAEGRQREMDKLGKTDKDKE